MPTVKIQSFIFFAIIASLCIAGIIITIFRNKKKTDNLIKNAFGKIPQYDNKDISYLFSYHKYASMAGDKPNLLDDITWNDLNMDNIFQRINACSSSIGEEYLYHVLHDLKINSTDMKKREEILRWMEEHPDKRIKIQKILIMLGKRKNNGLSTFLFNAQAKSLKHAWVYTVLALLPFLGMVLIPFFYSMGFFVIISILGINILVYSRKRLMLEGELETMQYFSALLHAAKSIQRKHANTMKLLDFDLSSALKPFRKIGGLIPGRMQNITNELESIIILFKTIFLIDLILYNRTVKYLIRYTNELNQLFQIVGELDACISIASYRHSLPWYCVPNFCSDNTIEFSEIYHPLLDNPVTNSGHISNDSIITGSNASGKSTFIKSVAINNILAQTISTCCAKQYSLCFSYVASSMAIKDDILTGDSYFITEIKSLKRIIEYCKERRCVCFIDEILRGTNTVERIAASTAVLKLLHETDSLCFVASHDIELTKILQGIYDNYHFSEKFENDTIEFDYLLKEGPSRSTNAIRLLKFMGFDKKIVDEAVRIAGTN